MICSQAYYETLPKPWRMPWPPGLGTASFGLGFGICGLTASANGESH